MNEASMLSQVHLNSAKNQRHTDRTKGQENSKTEYYEIRERKDPTSMKIDTGAFLM